MENQYKPQRFTNKFLLEVFPEALNDIIPYKISEWRKEYNTVAKNIKFILRKSPPKDLWFYEIFITIFFLPKLFECEKNLRRLRSFQIKPANKNKELGYFNFQEKLEIAKQYPILQIAEQYLQIKKSGNNYVALCPFHNEKSPSFYIYTSGNNYHCFGCGAHGDIINLIQHLCGSNFKEAVEILQN